MKCVKWCIIQFFQNGICLLMHKLATSLKEWTVIINSLTAVPWVTSHRYHHHFAPSKIHKESTNNVPKTMSSLRMQLYEESCAPPPMFVPLAMAMSKIMSVCIFLRSSIMKKVNVKWTQVLKCYMLQYTREKRRNQGGKCKKQIRGTNEGKQIARSSIGGLADWIGAS